MPLRRAISRLSQEVIAAREFLRGRVADLAVLHKAGIEVRPATVVAPPPRLVASEKRERAAAEVVEWYAIASAGLRDAPECYRPSGEWTEEFSLATEPLAKVLERGDVSGTISLLDDFHRSELSWGLGSYEVYGNLFTRSGLQKHRIRPLNYAIDVLRDAAMVQSVTGAPLEAMTAPAVGNPWGCEVPRGVMLTGGPKHFMNAWTLSNLADGRRKVICEIGGGYGGLALYLHRLNHQIRYFDFDLPIVGAMAAYQLMCVLPDRSVAIARPGDNLEKLSTSYAIVICPNYMLGDLRRADIVCNFSSLSEMAPRSIAMYLNHLERLRPEFFYHVNSDAPVRAVDGHVEIPGSAFPVPAEYRLIYKAPTITGRRTARQREFLYIRRERQQRREHELISDLALSGEPLHGPADPAPSISGSA